MRILLDENMPESVRHALRELGHEVDSVATLHLTGLDNGGLYQELAPSYDLFFTRDRAFVRTVRAIDTPASVKVILVRLPQGPRGGYARAFVKAFQRTDWSTHPNGSEWPTAG
ncbi:MAG TPA: DUF5615 family PIN-like protein [Methylomirabilota bacterium]|nr:DUF5615 family PIN-like protein [Methylomirabilota bacterium]